MGSDETAISIPGGPQKIDVFDGNGAPSGPKKQHGRALEANQTTSLCARTRERTLALSRGLESKRVFSASLAQLRQIYDPHVAKFEPRSLWNFIANISRPNRAEKSYERACISAFTTYTDA